VKVKEGLRYTITTLLHCYCVLCSVTHWPSLAALAGFHPAAFNSCVIVLRPGHDVKLHTHFHCHL